MKIRYLKIIILFFVIVIFFKSNVYSTEVKTDVLLINTTEPTIEKTYVDLNIDNRIEKELKNSIQTVYGKNSVDEIYSKIILHANRAIDTRPKKLKEQDIERDAEWYKNEIIYMFYVDHFGVIKTDKNNTFKNTEEMLDYLINLGVTTLICCHLQIVRCQIQDLMSKTLMP